MKDILTRIDCNFIPVKDLSASIDWYTNKLGCRFMWQEGDYAALNVHLSQEGQGNIVSGLAMITLLQVEEIVPMSFFYQQTPHPMINFYSSDIQYTHAKLKENGVQVSEIKDMGGIQAMEFTELNGHLMGICHF
ncbi:hypothetical protein XYCOK13_24410 [Xylanibacillus composti]|uniref:VOC domain-containing protein n=1 Tax=Xylanibacillus composti TaxID=1572762 RepID=A0A8J4H292_9BACL|nr:VOC family protein [Xylanibacillus composti]GIQ69617.1 hypothetical protein XYCOK13_24410 [Xylanibacillus composti]